MTTQAETTIPAQHRRDVSPATLISGARALVAVVAERAESANRNRTVSVETIAELQASGMLQALQPRRYGGLEIDPNAYLDAVSIVSEGCMSSGWICAVQGSTPFLIAQFPHEAQAEVWGRDPTTLVAGQLLPTRQVRWERSGYRITGRWPYVSGCVHSDWYVFGAIAPADAPTPGEYFIFIAPRSDCEIVDVWDVSGLKASASHDVAATDIFVPIHRTLRYADAMSGAGPGAGSESGIYLVPFAQIFVSGLTSTVVGALRGMFNLFVEHASKRVAVNGVRTSEDPVAQLLCAETASALDEMEVVRRRNFDAMVETARRGRMAAMEDRRRYKFQAAYSAERCTLLASRIFKASGSSAIFNRLPFARILADLQAGRQHVAFQFESSGRNWGAHILGGPVRPDMMV